MITFYDLASKEGITTFSPNPWKTRYVLNYKKIPYKTITVEYPDLESEFKKFGVPPSTTNPDGTPSYTSPSIIDDATKTAVSDSYKIAEYLDKTYPETPQVIPKGTEALQAACYEQFWQLMSSVFPVLLPRAPKVLKPRSAEYFIRTRTALYGKPLDELAPQGEELVKTWENVQAAFGKLDVWLNKSSGPFFMGDTITFADFVVAAMFKSMKVNFGEDSTEWEGIMTWNNERWKEFLEMLEPYASVEN